MTAPDDPLAKRIQALSPEKRRVLEQALVARRAQAHPAERALPTATPVSGLSSAQQRMWFLDRRDPGRAAYNVPVAVRLRGPLEPEILHRALIRVVDRHQILRTTYRERDGVVEAVTGRTNPAWRVVDLSDRDKASALETVDELAAADGLAAVDPTLQVLRTTLYRIDADEWILHLVAHHIAVDGWSTVLLLQDIERSYRELAGGVVGSEPPPAATYADYVRDETELLAGPRADAAIDFWRGVLAGAPDGVALAATAPPDAPAAHVGTLPFGIDEPLYSACKTFCRTRKITVFVGFLTALSLTLGRYTRSTDIVIGTEASVRHRADYADVIGLFVNQLALRTDLSGHPGLAEACRRVSAVVRGAFAHQELPFDRVVRALGRQGERQPLFNTVLSLRTADSAPHDPGELGDVRFEPLPDGGPKTFAPKFDLVFSMVDDGGRLGGAIEYDRRFFAEEALKGLAQALARVIEEGIRDPERPVDQIAICDPTLERSETGAWNDSRRAVSAPVGLHRSFERAHDRDPEHPALLIGDTVWSYARLERRANGLARRLISEGAGPERVVACCLARGPDLVASILAVLKAGAAVLVLDPIYASERWRTILADARPVVVLADAEGAALLPSPAPPLIRVESVSEQAGDRPDLPVEGDHLAYVIYTSGSTGTPKGVMGHHRGLAALSEAQFLTFGLGPADRVMQFSAITFDAFIWELALVWRAGATLVLHPDGMPQPDERFISVLRDARVGMLTIPPSVLDALPDADLPDLTRLVVAGEACPAAVTRRFAARRRMTNAYGPTEATVWASGETCVAGVAPTIGRPVANMRMHLVDRAMNPLPIGAVGEIALGGPAVTRGYLGQPGLTAERFRPDPFAETPGDRLYLTGDLGCRLPDGRVRYIGRADDQVKIRGFRVEPGEAQAMLATHPGVGQVVVSALPLEGRSQLVAWWTARGDGCDEPDLRAFAAEKLPSYLRPSAYVQLQTFPLTPHGKIDRKALVPPDGGSRRRTGEPDPPHPGVESRLAEVWAAALGLDRVGRDENFFELGGDSILSVQVVSRARAAGLGFTAVQLFAHPTVAGLAPLVEGAGPHAAEAAGPTGADLPLSSLQEGLLFHCLRDPTVPLYVQRFELALDGPLDLDALERAWNGLIGRHESLRTTILWRSGEHPIQRVAETASLAIRRLDLTALDRAQRDKALSDLRDEESKNGFDLEVAPLVRCTAVRVASRTWRVFWACHHLIVDGWSFAVIERDLFALYDMERRTADDPMPQVPQLQAPQFRDYLGWIARQDAEAAKAWWAERLHAFDTPMRLSDRLPGAEGAGSDFWGEVSEVLDPAADRRLRAFAAERGLTLNTLVQAAWALVLSRHLRRRDVLYGMIVAGRPADLAGVEDIVGLFINTLPCRLNVTPADRVVDFLEEVQRSVAEMQARSFLSLAELQRLCDIPSGESPFDALLVVQSLPPGGSPPADLTVSSEPVAARTDYPLTVIVEAAGRTALRFVHDRRSLGRDRTAALAAGLRTALEALPDAAGASVGAWPSLPATATEIVVGAFGSGPPMPAEPPSLLDQVSARAADHPERIALVLEGETRSYGALESNSNRLAQWLRGRGIGPESVVALYLDRSFDLIESMLAVMKAGGAFLPLGLEVPGARLVQMIEEAAPAVVLTQSGLRDRLPETGTEVVALDNPQPPWRDCADRRPAPCSEPENAVYVFYTSGSTGRPKGVLNSLAGVTNRVQWGQRVYPLGADDRVMQKTPYNFDVSFWEWIWPLTVGGRLVIARPDGHRDPAYIADLAAREGVTLMHFVPSMLQVFLEDPARARRCSALKRILCSGEAIGSDLRDRCRSLTGIDILNLYGPTEAAIEVTHWHCRDDETGAAVPMGRPISGVDLRVVDPDGHPCPVGVAGELLIGGVAAARGYVARPGLTAERFRPDPAASRPGARVYHTGDLAAWRSDGALDYLGRVDWQVKIRGQRVELAEIESVLRSADGVRDATVLYREAADGDGRLVAYLVGEPDRSAIDALLTDRLPAVMHPSDFVTLDALPKTASGKLDRAALPEPDRAAASGTGRGGAPKDSTERAVAALFGDVLGRSGIGVDDRFAADLGGHSLQVLRIVGRIDRRWPGRLTLSEFLRDPTVSGVSRRLVGSTGGDERSPLLVPLRTDGDRRPLFVVHPALGAVICYLELARHLPEDRPIYAIQAPELAGERAGENLVELAARYRAAARGVQPDGPLAIAGYSYGGLVAFEMARQEAQAGAAPALLAVLDTLAPPAEPSGDAGPGEAALLAELATVLERYGGGAPSFTAEEVLAVPEADRLDHVRRRLSQGGALEGLAETLDLGSTLAATRGAGRARAGYRPGPYSGALNLMRCETPSEEDTAGVDPSTLADPALGWGRWVHGPIDVARVPGDHVDLLRGENAAAIAVWLAARLDP